MEILCRILLVQGMLREIHLCRRLYLELRFLAWARILENGNCGLKGCALMTSFLKGAPPDVAPASGRKRPCLFALEAEVVSAHACIDLFPQVIRDG